MRNSEGNRPTNRPSLSNAKNSARSKPYRVNELLHAPEGTRTPNRLIRSQQHPFTFNDNLPYFRGKPSVGAGLSRHSRRTLP